MKMYPVTFAAYLYTVPPEIAFHIMYIESCFQTLITWQDNPNTDSGAVTNY